MSYGFDEESQRLEWCDKWAPPCPDGHALRVERPLGFRERTVRELELRVVLTDADLGVCQVILDEHEDEVYVRVLVAYDEDEEDAAPRPPHRTNCPVRTWLEQPLGDRAVIDVDSDEELPLYVPEYRDNVKQTDWGYHRVTRRRGAGADRTSIDDP